MNQLLLERSSGNIGPNVFARIQTSSLLRSFSAAPASALTVGSASRALTKEVLRYQSETLCPMAVHRGRLCGLIRPALVSGGSDATIKIWDLEQCSNQSLSDTYRPVAVVARAGSGKQDGAGAKLAAEGHRFGVTHLSFYAFDSAAFLSSSYDQTLKLWSTRRARVSGSFDLGSKVHTHALSPIASHLLVACGTQHPAVRLVDLRSSAAVQSLVSPGQIGGSAGATLAVAWSPVHEHVLATGSVDGAVRIWDVRRASGLVALLDHEDATGYRAPGRQEPHLSAKAHTGPVNGLTWTDNGDYIISAGHDRRIRVWDAATGANTLANFGPSIRNSQMGTVTMFVSPTGLTPPGSELLFFPNETEILVMDLHEGSTITRLRGMGPAVASVRAQRGGERAIKNRLTSISWRGAGSGGSSSGVVMGGSNAPGGIYSGHSDGQIRAWIPQLEGTDGEDYDKNMEDVPEAVSKKRKALDDAFQSLMGKRITFS
ncbi:DNA excision repair protein ckn1 [Madurella mycetomatis]|uniref:DNA excision repair protein ckn1 n=1 Tax=Madurella mycetomatis TaxID=100816 RepID=A0A175VTB5_9PEZI|nr:DNA excision repair protein ckn1 [Madurella mycetomatis]